MFTPSRFGFISSCGAKKENKSKKRGTTNETEKKNYKPRHGTVKQQQRLKKKGGTKNKETSYGV